MVVETDEDSDSYISSILTIKSTNDHLSILDKWRSVSHMSTSLWGSTTSLRSSTLEIPRQNIEVFAPEADASNSEQIRAVVDKPDTGYAWIVLASCAILQMVPCIPLSSVGIFYVEFLSSFDYGEQAISWVCSLQPAVIMMSGPLAALLMDCVGARMSALLGCVSTGIALAITSFTTNFYVLFLAYGILTGMFLSCIQVPAVVYPTQFFRKYRVLALALATCSTPITFLVVPPVVTYLVSRFSWRDANLFLAAVCIQASACAMLLRPVKIYEKLDGEEHKKEMPSASRLSLSTDNYNHSSSEPKKRVDDIYPMANNDNALMRSVLTLEPIPETETLTIQIYEKPNMQTEDVDMGSELSQTKLERFLNRAHFFCHWRMGVVITSNFFWGWASSLIYVLLPEMAREKELTKDEICQLFLISGAVGFSCRVLYAGSSQIVHTQRVYAAIIGHGLIALALFIFMWSTSFLGFVLVIVPFTAGYSLLACFGAPILLELHGEEGMSMIYGFTMFTHGAASMLAPPLTTYLQAAQVHSDTGLLIGAICSLLGGLLYIPHVIIKTTKQSTSDI